MVFVLFEETSSISLAARCLQRVAPRKWEPNNRSFMAQPTNPVGRVYGC